MAFDNLDQSAALKIMRERSYPHWFTNFYESYLRDRTAVCNINGTTRRKFPKGSPQGGVFSPSFWNIAFDELLEKMNAERRFLGVGFADDANLMIKSIDPFTLVEGIQSKLPTLVEWSKKYGVEFCPKKTVAVLFGKKKPKRPLPPLKLGGGHYKV